MKLRIIRVYKGFPILQFNTKKYCINTILWTKGRWNKWEIKNGLSCKTIKAHPFEMTVYY